MKGKRFTEEQIAFALRQAESGVPVVEICRKMEVSEATFYRWKKKFAGRGVAELRRLKQSEEENRKLKQLVADLSLDKHMLQDVLKKSGETGDATTDGPLSNLKRGPEGPTRMSGPSSSSVDLQVSK